MLNKHKIIWILSVVSVVHGNIPRPNIVFILADDLGFNDVSFHGSSQIPTPNIDALAYSGIILNRYYVAPVCTPSRAALMTGKYPIHLGMQHDVIHALEPRGLALNEKLLPQYLNELGYKSHIVGKWHLGHWKRAYTPLYRGFASHVGLWTGRHDYNDHTAMASHTWGYDIRRGMDVAWDLRGNKYTTDIITDESVKIIKTHNTSNPLFLYIPHLAVHSCHDYDPLPAPDEVVDEMKHIENYQRRRYAAILTILDRSVGTVVNALNDAKMLENTIIVFSTDNGGAPEGFNLNQASNWPLRGAKYTLWEGGVRGVGLIWSPLLRETQRVSNQLMHISDWLPTLYSAAGGDVSSLPQNLDGVNLWESLSLNMPSPRSEALLNIDRGIHAIIVDNFKLVTLNQQINKNGWYGPRGNRDPLSYNIDTVENSQVGKLLSNLRMMTDREVISQLRQNATLSCSPVKGSPCVQNKPCLYDIYADPCETNNIAPNHPNIVKSLVDRIKFYRRSSKPPTNTQEDPRGKPEYWNRTWTNFGDYLDNKKAKM